MENCWEIRILESDVWKRVRREGEGVIFFWKSSIEGRKRQGECIFEGDNGKK